MCKKIFQDIKNKKLLKEYRKKIKNTKPLDRLGELANSNNYSSLFSDANPWNVTTEHNYGSVRCSKNGCDTSCVITKENVQTQDDSILEKTGFAYMTLKTGYSEDKYKGKDWEGQWRYSNYSGAEIKTEKTYQPEGIYVFIFQIHSFPDNYSRMGIWTLHDTDHIYREQDIMEHFNRPGNPFRQVEITSHAGKSSLMKDRKMYKRRIDPGFQRNELVLYELDFRNGTKIIERVNGIPVFESNMFNMNYPFKIIISNYQDAPDNDPDVKENAVSTFEIWEVLHFTPRD